MINKSPNLPKAPDEYSSIYMDQLMQILTAYFRSIDNPGHLQAVTANFSYLDGTILTRGLVKVGVLNAPISTGAIIVPLVDTTNFPNSGTAFIVDGPTSDRIQYTAKTATQLQGVTGVTNAHGANKLVVASGRTGDVFADPLTEYTLKIIP